MPDETPDEDKAVPYVQVRKGQTAGGSWTVQLLIAWGDRANTVLTTDVGSVEPQLEHVDFT